MRIEKEFIRLPLSYDVERLKQELSGFREEDWIVHPSGYSGNSAVPLISVDGEINDAFMGTMLPTPHLAKCPYFRQVIASFKSVFSRSRLMRLGSHCEVPEHSDISYHWFTRVRIHIPIITTPEVIFYCGDEKVHMEAGKAWIFDSWKMHKVVNASSAARVHLVVDTCGSPEFWDLVAQSGQIPDNTRRIPFDPDADAVIETERFNGQTVMSPGEVDALTEDLISDMHTATVNEPAQSRLFEHAARRFIHGWRTIWAIHGSEQSGWPIYRKLIDETLAVVIPLQSITLGSNEASPSEVFHVRVLQPALNTSLATQTTHTAQPGQQRQKTGRNDPCPCGSGKKYKKCHGGAARAQ